MRERQLAMDDGRYDEGIDVAQPHGSVDVIEGQAEVYAFTQQFLGIGDSWPFAPVTYAGGICAVHDVDQVQDMGRCFSPVLMGMAGRIGGYVPGDPIFRSAGVVI